MAAKTFDTVRTRFAPSPTGYLHIGGARTALFNYLLARRLGGKFILRIEDTDQTRNIRGAEKKLVEDMRWLGLHWDEGPEVGGPAGTYHQSERLEDYRAHARRLLDEGKAYYAFDTQEELKAMRAEAERARRNFRYPRPASFPAESEAEKARSEGRPVVVRLKTPDRGYAIKDTILGDVEVKASEMDDFVILKGDGWPTYHFAVVVDDEAMLVTHVLRGQEHLLNTAKHLALQEAFDYHTPTYAHLPIILNMDGSKMSKREKDRAVRAAVEAGLRSGKLDERRALELSGVGDSAALAAWRSEQTQLEAAGLNRLARALAVQLPEIEIHDFRVSGYLPEVLLNFIALLGWSPGGDRERMTVAEMCERFSVERVGKTNARFDRQKLLNFNTVALAEATPERRLAALKDYIAVNEDCVLRGLPDATLAELLRMCEGLRTMRDVEDKAGVLFVPDDAYPYDDEAVQKTLIKGDAAGLSVLREMRDLLAGAAEWSAAALDGLVRGYCEKKSLGLGKAAQPVRVAVTGRTISPPIFDTLALLGRERTLTRIDRTLRHVTRQ